MTVQTIPPIRAQHLERTAVVYIRVSTDYQARNSTGSLAWQYSMVDEATRHGWARQNVTVIDEDQGQSGTEYFHREGFKWMFDEVAAGRVGAIICTEVSRLSRDSGDWNLLLKVCRATDTLVADGNKVYDLSNYSDRLFLNIAGTMSEAERDLMLMRSRQATLAKAKLGEVIFRAPTGYIIDKAGKYQIDLEVDEKQGRSVFESISLVFEMFERLCSGSAVVAYFNREGILFPTRAQGGPGGGSLSWKKLRRARCYSILKSPVFAGAYVFGRSQVKMRVVTDNHPRVEKYRGDVQIQDWAVIKLNNHEGYISWEKFLENQEKLKNNRSKPTNGSRGALREGAALLQGNAYCGICGHRLFVQYTATQGQPRYTCAYPQRIYSAGLCQSMPLRAVDEAVEKAYLRAIEPAQLQLALRVGKEAEKHEEKKEASIRRQLDKARDEADLARRRFMQVDPDNRLVAQQLERDWNDRLSELDRLGKDFTRTPRSQRTSLNTDDRKKLEELSKDLPNIWRAQTTTQVERKQLLSFVIERVKITRFDEDAFIEIFWRTGALTQMKVPLQLKRTQRRVIDLIRELAVNHTDQEIAEHLNREGFKSARGRTFHTALVEYLRYSYAIPIGSSAHSRFSSQSQRGDGRYRARDAALILEASVRTVIEMCKEGMLDGVQEKFYRPWWVRLPEEQIPTLKEAVIKRKYRRKGWRGLEDFHKQSKQMAGN
jgi:DNA invertase Pin-like site-specific DNA recombinase